MLASLGLFHSLVQKLRAAIDAPPPVTALPLITASLQDEQRELEMWLLDRDIRHKR